MKAVEMIIVAAIMTEAPYLTVGQAEIWFRNFEKRYPGHIDFWLEEMDPREVGKVIGESILRKLARQQ